MDIDTTTAKLALPLLLGSLLWRSTSFLLTHLQDTRRLSGGQFHVSGKRERGAVSPGGPPVSLAPGKLTCDRPCRSQHSQNSVILKRRTFSTSVNICALVGRTLLQPSEDSCCEETPECLYYPTQN